MVKLAGPAHAGGATNDSELVSFAGLLGVGEKFLHVSEFAGEVSPGASEVAGRFRHVSRKALFMKQFVCPRHVTPAIVFRDWYLPVVHGPHTSCVFVNSEPAAQNLQVCSVALSSS